jgi:hypothetical protein
MLILALHVVLVLGKSPAASSADSAVSCDGSAATDLRARAPNPINRPTNRTPLF